LAQRLLEKETISLPDIVEILGPRPYPCKKSLLDYLEELKERTKEDEEAARKAEETASELQKETDENNKQSDDKNKEES